MLGQVKMGSNFVTSKVKVKASTSVLDLASKTVMLAKHPEFTVVASSGIWRLRGQGNRSIWFGLASNLVSLKGMVVDEQFDRGGKLILRPSPAGNAGGNNVSVLTSLIIDDV